MQIDLTRKERMEQRDGGIFRVIAQRNETGAWEFWDNEQWEARWYPCKATEERLAWANSDSPGQ